MIYELSNGIYDCVICQSKIGVKGRIWSCSNCFNVLHLSCVDKWAFEKEKNDSLSQDRIMLKKEEIKKIKCPSCNYIHKNHPVNIFFIRTPQFPFYTLFADLVPTLRVGMHSGRSASIHCRLPPRFTGRRCAPGA